MQQKPFNACERYIYIENLLTPSEVAKETAAPSKDDPPSKTVVAIENPKPSASPEMPKVPAHKTASRSDTEKLKKLISRAYTNVSEENGWALVSRIDQYLQANHSDFDPRNYGSGTFPKLLATLDFLEVVQLKQGNGKAQFCRPKQNGSVPSKPPQASQKAPVAYLNALKAAVASSQSNDGWADISTIFSHLQKDGYLLESTGYAKLNNDLLASGFFDMRDGGGKHKDFRLNASFASAKNEL